MTDRSYSIPNGMSSASPKVEVYQIPTGITMPSRAVYTECHGMNIPVTHVVECGEDNMVTAPGACLWVKAGKKTKVFVRNSAFEAGRDFSAKVWTRLWANETPVEHSDVLVVDPREYTLRYLEDEKLYTAGCRSFTYEEAVKHWSNPEHADVPAAHVLLKAIEDHHTSLPAVVTYPNGRAWKYRIDSAKDHTHYLLERPMTSSPLAYAKAEHLDRVYVQRSCGEYNGPYLDNGNNPAELETYEVVSRWLPTADEVMRQAGYDVQPYVDCHAVANDAPSGLIPRTEREFPAGEHVILAWPNIGVVQVGCCSNPNQCVATHWAPLPEGFSVES